MEKSFSDLEKSIVELTDRLNKAELRISALEKNRVFKHEDVIRHEADESSSVFPKLFPGVSRVKVFTIIGRTFLILAGAFLLRVFTENNTFAPLTGVIIGLGYALLWLLLTIRSAQKKDLVSSSFFGISSIIIAFPLLYEATVKLSVFSPMISIIILSILTGIALSISFFYNLRSVYVLYVLAAIFTSLPLMIITGKVELFCIYIILISLFTLSFKYFKDWHTMPWVSIFFANLSLAFLITLSSDPEKLVGKYQGISINLSLLIIIIYTIIYLSVFIYATLYLKRQISVFGMFQSIFALIIGLMGSISITHGTGIGYYTIGGFASFFAVSFYFIALKVLPKEDKVNFYYFSWMAFILAVAGTWVLLEINSRIVVLGLLSLTSLILIKYIDRVNTLSIQSVLYILLAAWFSKLIKMSLSVFISDDLLAYNASLIFHFVLVLIIILYAIYLILGVPKDQKIHIPRFIVLVLVVISLFGYLIHIIGNAFALKDGVYELHKISLIRTVILSFSTVLLAWLSNRPKFYELTYLVYPLIIITGIKLVLKDISNGTAMTLFAGFVIYGISLIAAPKIKRKE